MFRLSKENIIADIVLAFFWVILLLSVPFFGLAGKLANYSIGMKSITIAVSILFAIIIYYPLTCSLVFAYKSIAGKENVKHTTLLAAILIIIIWNPFTGPVLLLKGATDIHNNVINEPCGLEVIGLADNSPARDAGISIGDIIISADGNAVDSTDSFMHAMADKRSGDMITIGTKQKEYAVNVIPGPEGRGGVIGINIKSKYCPRD